MAASSVDTLGWVYIGLYIGWTVAFIGGMVFLYIHRALPSVRMRRLPLLLAGLVSLHFYASVCWLEYVIGKFIPCTLEFWFMSLYLPFGFAMFHAANSQFLHTASRQKQFATRSPLTNERSVCCEKQAARLANSRWRRILRGVERADKINRLMFCIGVGLAVNTAVSLFVFFGSRKFHSSYGLWDWNVHGTESEIRAKCSRGWEWWISIVWQFFWAWIYAPYMLLKSRGIRDIHGWRLQTICCCLAGLPATPLWLTGLYAPQMAPVNAVWTPAAWFALCVFVIEVATVGFPIIDIIKTKALQQETLDAIAAWEKRKGLSRTTRSTFSRWDTLSKAPSHSTLSTEVKVASNGKARMDSTIAELLNMATLEHSLRTNSQPLLEFAALKDFSGENISFLTHAAAWRRTWVGPSRNKTELRRQQFIDAVKIYSQLISLDMSEFPINISSREMKRLRTVFEAAATLLRRSSSLSSSSTSVTPFDTFSDNGKSSASESGHELDNLGKANLRAVTEVVELGSGVIITSMDIPEAFDETVFDTAEKEIKYLVLTDTWPKFVTAEFDSRSRAQDLLVEDRTWMRKVVLCSA